MVYWICFGVVALWFMVFGLRIDYYCHHLIIWHWYILDIWHSSSILVHRLLVEKYNKMEEWKEETAMVLENECIELTAEIVAEGLRTLGFHPLYQRHALLELNIAGLSLRDISLLKNYPHVLYLDISNNQIESLQVLENMSCLVQLKAR